MPRAAKTQPATPYPGSQYGQGIDQVQAQHVIPLADERAGSAGTGNAQGVATTAPGPQPVAVPDLDSVTALAQAEAPMPPLMGSGGPMTAGLPTGAGPGPGMLRPPTHTGTGRLLRQMAAVTGDSYWLQLAQRSNL